MLQLLTNFGYIDKIEKVPREIVNPNVQKDILWLEKQEGSMNFKFGVILAKAGQIMDDELFSNESGGYFFRSRFFTLSWFIQNTYFFSRKPKLWWFLVAAGRQNSAEGLVQVQRSDLIRAYTERNSEYIYNLSRWSRCERKYDWDRECVHNTWGARDNVPCLNTFAILPRW